MTQTSTQRAVPWFLIPSLLGLMIFVVPVPDGEGSITIPVAFLAGAAQDGLAGALPWLTVGLMAVSVVGTLAYRTFPETWKERHLVRALFSTTPVWFGLRVLGLVFGLMTVLQLGPEWLWGEDTGDLIFGLAAVMVTVFFFAGFLLPLLLNFGLLEFAGVLLNKVMRPLFTVPGRSSIDSLASWLGDATIGVLMTNQQYVQGYYTKREAAVLGTTFNVVSLTFTIVIMGYLSLQHMFAPFYATIVVAGLAAAMIMPRIPPLSRFSDSYADWVPAQGTEAQDHAAHDADAAGAAVGGRAHVLRRAWDSALERSSTARIGDIGRRGASNVLEMWVGIIPIIMAVGTVAVLIAEHTPLFSWLGAPFVPVLELLGVPEAAAASETLFIGFADMLLPAVIGAGIEAEMTRFIIGCLSVTQLIFMSEVGGLLLASKIPVRLHHLVMIFLLRTLITLPIIIGLAHLFY
ncbi:YjiH family protein [Nesterenkonia xinjiangensis]|uniref:Nucleoside recognition membrane protein YjiH n=1 Tax=Nesterenkonia xinjiangensis TaxID=225327 RepID=A0A7Z0GPK4_9MICC|nr:YjiH family protein [Nesterenkonia xinjiangensis]NYJ78748.1 nucleoside recognition membrane protein YjiH [Nesterenkonia xinjiangensis]